MSPSYRSTDNGIGPGAWHRCAVGRHRPTDVDRLTDRRARRRCLSTSGEVVAESDRQLHRGRRVADVVGEP